MTESALAPVVPGRALSGPEKAAALLLIVGPPTAARLIKHFDQPDLRIIARAAAGLGSVPPSLLDALVEEFAGEFTGGLHLTGDAAQARTLFADALPAAEVDSLLDAALGPDGEMDVWEALAEAPDSVIIAFLNGERPATATYMLSRLAAPLAARIVSALPRDRRNAALCGLVAPYEPTPLAGQIVEDALRGFLKQSKAPGAATDGRSRIAGIINALDPDAAEDVMRAIGEARPKDAAAIQSMLFSFNDLPKLSQRGRALLFDRAEIDIVVMSLRGSDAEFRNAVLSSMPSRGRRLVEGELASGAQASAKDVAKARRAIAEIVLGMAAKGEIELSQSAGEGA